MIIRGLMFSRTSFPLESIVKMLSGLLRYYGIDESPILDLERELEAVVMKGVGLWKGRTSIF